MSNAVERTRKARLSIRVETRKPLEREEFCEAGIGRLWVKGEMRVRKRRQRGGRWISQAFLTPIMSNVQNLNSLRKNMTLGVSKYEFESRPLFRSKLVS